MTSLDSSLFRINMPTGKPQPGSLLVAEPFLREDHFNHAVISLIDYSHKEPVMGLVLNKPTGYTIGDAVDGIVPEADLPIFCGGPVACDRLFYIHTLGEVIPGSKKFSDTLYIGGDFETVKDLINQGIPAKGAIRFFVGYSGWEPGQLEDEIRKHVWAVAPKPVDSEILRHDGDSFWYRIVRSMGEQYRNWLYHPLNPQMN